MKLARRTLGARRKKRDAMRLTDACRAVSGCRRASLSWRGVIAPCATAAAGTCRPRHRLGGQPLISVQALTHSVNGTQLSPDDRRGTPCVASSSTRRRSKSSSVALKTSQCVGAVGDQRARLRVGRRLTEALRPPAPALGRGDVVHPHGTCSSGARPSTTPSTCRTIRSHPPWACTASIVAPLACGQVDDDLPRRAEHGACPARARPADRCSRPVLTDDEPAGPSSSAIAASNCSWSSAVRVRDAEVGLRGHQVDRRVGDVDRRCRTRSSCPCRRRRRRTRRPTSRGLGDASVLYIKQVRAPAVGHAVGLAVDSSSTAAFRPSKMSA